MKKNYYSKVIQEDQTLVSCEGQQEVHRILLATRWRRYFSGKLNQEALNKFCNHVLLTRKVGIICSCIQMTRCTNEHMFQCFIKMPQIGHKESSAYNPGNFWQSLYITGSSLNQSLRRNCRKVEDLEIARRGYKSCLKVSKESCQSTEWKEVCIEENLESPSSEKNHRISDKAL